MEQEAKETQVSYELILSKAQKLQMTQNWESAFRNLCYFAGEYGSKLPKDTFINLCSNIVRCGIKSGSTNLQEISFWLKKAVEASLKDCDQESLEDALDLIDTYSSYFKEEPSGKGKKALVEILSLAEDPACEMKLWGSYKRCADSIFLNHHE